MFKTLKNFINKKKENKYRKSRITRALYSTDISIYEILPSEVFFPSSTSSTEQVQEILEYAKKQNLTIHSRGSGTSVAGQSLGHGAILDFTKFMNKIIKIEKDYVDVEPGIIYDDLNKELAKFNNFLPPDPSSGDLCTVGGMVSNNASGLHSYLYGDTNKFVIGLEGFWADGSFFSTIDNIGTELITNRLMGLQNEARSLFLYLPKVDKDSCGYNIKDSFVFDEKGNETINLNSLLVGSEGTLATITKIRFKIINLPEKRINILAQFDSIEKSIQGISIAQKYKDVSSIELLDNELISISKDNFAELRAYFLDETKAGLIIELDGTNSEIEKHVQSIYDELLPICLKIEISNDEKQRKKIWWMRKAANPILSRIDGNKRSLRIIDDMAVPVDFILRFYKEQKKILDFFGLRTAFFGHVGSGHFHINPQINTRSKDYHQIIAKVCDESYSLVKQLGGTFSAEHGDGILRAAAIKKFNPELYAFYLKIKEIFDPNWILNPGKILEKPNQTSEFSCNNRYSFRPVFDISDQLLSDIEKCHGCNHCLNFCESFINSKNIKDGEGNKTRGRANLLRAIINGTINSLDIKGASEYIDNCLKCGQCFDKCPSGVDMIKLASDLRQSKVLPIAFKYKLLMAFYLLNKLILKHKLKKQKNTKVFVSKRLVPVKMSELCLYYIPYFKSVASIIKKNNLIVETDNEKLKIYLERY